MNIKLEKGQAVSLNKDSGNELFKVGGGWDTSSAGNTDIDMAAALIGSDGKPRGLVSFANLVSDCGGVRLTGDNRTGEGDGYDEEIYLDFSKIPADITKVAMVTFIYSGASNFGLVKNLSIDVVDEKTSTTLATFLPELEASLDKAIVLGEFIRTASGVSFKALGVGYPTRVEAFKEYGINV